MSRRIADELRPILEEITVKQSNTGWREKRGLRTRGFSALFARSGSRAERNGDDSPPRPKGIDPAGPEQSTWPRGKLNFGNVVFGLGLLIMVIMVVLGMIESSG